MKSISVLLSTYNGEKYLRELLESILKQQDVSLSLWIRDDGSSDSTLSILEEYKNKYNNIHLIKGKNVGYIQSFWTLLQNTHDSEYYAFCDQDDIWEENKCISAIQYLEETNTKGPLLYTSNVKGVDSMGKIIQDEVFPVHSVLSFADSLQRGSLPGCTFVFNEELRKEASRYAGPQISHDWTLYCIAKAIGSVLYDSNSYIRYRLHDQNTVGIEQSKIQHIKTKITRFIKGDYTQVRSSIAKSILDTYANQMNQEDIDTATLFSSYIQHPTYIFQLLKYKEYRNLNFIIQALTNKI